MNNKKKQLPPTAQAAAEKKCADNFKALADRYRKLKAVMNLMFFALALWPSGAQAQQFGFVSHSRPAKLMEEISVAQLGSEVQKLSSQSISIAKDGSMTLRDGQEELQLSGSEKVYRMFMGSKMLYKILADGPGPHTYVMVHKAKGGFILMIGKEMTL